MLFFRNKKKVVSLPLNYRKAQMQVIMTDYMILVDMI